MSFFKIETILPSSTLEARLIQLPPAPSIAITVPSMSLLTYDLELLLESVHEYLKGEDNYQLLEKTLKVLGSSLNDKKLSGNLEQIIFQHQEKEKRIYELLILWSHVCRNLIGILLKLSVKLRKFLIYVMVSQYFFQKTKGEQQIKNQLSQILSISDQKQLLKTLCQSYVQKEEPLKSLIEKTKQIKTQNNDLIELIQSILKFAIEKSDAKVSHMIQFLSENEDNISFLNQQLPNISTTLIKHFKKTISINNIFYERNVSKEFNVMIRSAIKEWMEDEHHFWEVADRYFSMGGKNREDVIKWGSQLGKENVFNLSMSIKYIYFFFQGEEFQFDCEDRMIFGIKTKQPWIDIYKGIAQCTSWSHFNLMTINVTNAIKHWKILNPFSLTIRHKGLKNVVDHYKDKYEKFRQDYLDKNKRIELAYSTFLIKLDGVEKIVTFEQLFQYCEKDIPIENRNYRTDYKPFQEEIRIKDEPRKDHNIVVEARLVRILKRNKTSLTIDFLSQESKYDEQVVTLAMKRLVNKGIAELQNNHTYTYIP